MLGASLDFGVQIGELNDRLDRLSRLAKFGVDYQQIMTGHPARSSTILPPAASLAAAQPVVIADPPGGMVWQIQRMTFGLPQMVDASVITTQGTIIVYSGGIEVARTTTVPNFITGKDFTFVATPNEFFTAVWIGGVIAGGATNGLVVDVAAAEYPILAPTYIDV